MAPEKGGELVLEPVPEPVPEPVLEPVLLPVLERVLELVLLPVPAELVLEPVRSRQRIHLQRRWKMPGRQQGCKW